MRSLYFRKESLVARVHVFKELLPASGRQKASNRMQGKWSSFTQMRKKELKTHVNNLPEKNHAMCLQDWSSANGTVFHEITVSRLVCDSVRADPLRVQNWAGKYEEPSQPTYDEYIGGGPIVIKTKTAVPTSPSKLISNGVFTPKGLILTIFSKLRYGLLILRMRILRSLKKTIRGILRCTLSSKCKPLVHT